MPWKGCFKEALFLSITNSEDTLLLLWLLRKKLSNCSFFFCASCIKRNKVAEQDTGTHLLTLVFACLCELSLTPFTENLIITNGQMAKIRLLWFCQISVFEPSLLEEVPTVTGHVSPPQTCPRLHVCWSAVGSPRPRHFHLAGPAGWRLPFSPTLQLSAVLLPTCWVHANLHSTSRLQTCCAWSQSNGSALNMFAQETN